MTKVTNVFGLVFLVNGLQLVVIGLKNLMYKTPR